MVMRRLMRARAWMCGPVLSGGLASIQIMLTGRPSMAWKSMGLAARPMAMTRSLVPWHLPCGMARPLPMPVVRVASRSRTASRTFLASVTSPVAARTLTNSPIASVLVLAWRGILMLAALRISLKRIFCSFPGKSVSGESYSPKGEAPNLNFKFQAPNKSQKARWQISNLRFGICRLFGTWSLKLRLSSSRLCDEPHLADLDPVTGGIEDQQGFSSRCGAALAGVFGLGVNEDVLDARQAQDVYAERTDRFVWQRGIEQIEIEGEIFSQVGELSRRGERALELEQVE